MQACLQKNYLQNVLYLLKVDFSKLRLRMIFKVLFYKSIFSYFKGLIFQNLFLFCIMQAKPFWAQLEIFLKIFFYFEKLVFFQF
jgi:hypothetical protein